MRLSRPLFTQSQQGIRREPPDVLPPARRSPAIVGRTVPGADSIDDGHVLRHGPGRRWIQLGVRRAVAWGAPTVSSA